jgi:isoleucyl-tRNA synthetase
LADFDPTENLLPPEALLYLDKQVLGDTQRLHDDIVQAYLTYQFHVASQKIQLFCSVKMGGFYLDIIKDRLYTTQKNSVARRSAQTAMYYILQALVRWMAPILSFTAEEIWQHQPWGSTGSVFLTTWEPSELFGKNSQDIAPADTFLEDLRSCVNKQLEQARNAQQIGSALAAEVELICDDTRYQKLAEIGDELRFILITASAKLHRISEYSAGFDQATCTTEMEGLWVVVRPSTHPKCERCWHRCADVGANTAHPDICGRCVENVVGKGEVRRYA